MSELKFCEVNEDNRLHYTVDERTTACGLYVMTVLNHPKQIPSYVNEACEECGVQPPPILGLP